MSVLVLRALGIGDLACAVPALRALRAAFPAEQVTLAAPAWVHPLARLAGAVDRFVDVPDLHAAPGDVPPADVAVNLHGRGPQSHNLLRATRPRRLLGFRGPGCPDGPLWSDDEHEVDRWCRLLDWYGIAADPADLSLHVPAVEPVVAGAAIVHPGAKFANRRWPPDRFAAVARYLADQGRHVVITGSSTERDLALRVARAAGLGTDRVLAGHTDVASLCALVSAARLVVCGDTGIGHLATAYGTPSVLLFGRVPPRLWGPPAGRARHRVLWHRAAAIPLPRNGSGCDRPDPELLAITVAEVLDAAGEAGTGDRTTPGRPGVCRRPSGEPRADWGAGGDNDAGAGAAAAGYRGGHAAQARPR